ncbi:arylamine N-acetyltransferase family protein [Aspergillus stella-maris]|uniref:arylamine N-acetyltransferase family protein n=1 Tax=Aspergillus stella-maris TaxID=1810926 RepID=UPI003CCD74C7
MSTTDSPFTTDQLNLYLERIHYADDANATDTSRLATLQAAIEKKPLFALNELQRRHLASIPWGNTALHYSTHHSISTHPTAVFEKLVVQRRDGYCMENTNLLYFVLRALGYKVYPTAARVSRAALPGNRDEEEGYIALSHMVLIVRIGPRKYMVDVGFGRNAPTSPLQLQLEVHIAVRLFAPMEMSVVKEPLSESVDETQRFWVFKTHNRNDPDSPWIPQYCFSEVEFLPEDFGMINFFTSQSRTMFFTQQLVCTKLILEEGGFEPLGIYILSGTEVKKVIGGVSEVVARFTKEEDRVEALKEYFGMSFLPYEVEGVRGLSSEIRSG